jgi:hypothetical protein
LFLWFNWLLAYVAASDRDTIKKIVQQQATDLEYLQGRVVALEEALKSKVDELRSVEQYNMHLLGSVEMRDATPRSASCSCRAKSSTSSTSSRSNRRSNSSRSFVSAALLPQQVSRSHLHWCLESERQAEATETERDAVRELEVLRQRDAARLQSTLLAVKVVSLFALPFMCALLKFHFFLSRFVLVNDLKAHEERAVECTLRIEQTQLSITELLLQNNAIV